MGRFVFFRKKERWSTTWLGKLSIILVLIVLFLIFLTNIHPFLAQNNPIESKIMVLEGFVPDYVVEEAKEIFIAGKYEKLLITGKQRMKGSYLDIYKNDGEYSAATLEKLGFDMTLVSVIPISYTVTKDRTYESGKAIKEYCDQLDNIKSINLVSIGCHSRRSRYLFEKVFDNKINIGITCIHNRGFNPDRWWQSSVGFRQVIQETIAWTYARFFFYP